MPESGRAQVALLDACGGRWPTPLGVVLVERPLAIRLTEAGALHATDGPAVEYADGWRIWASRGNVVTRAAIEDPASLTVDAIQAVADPTRRGEMVHRYGRATYTFDLVESADRIANEPATALARSALAAFGGERDLRARGTVIDSGLDAAGQPRRLWRGERRNDEALVAVEVVNSTPEPDGSRTHHFLRVLPSTTRCRDAVAWTFGLAGPQYQPALET